MERTAPVRVVLVEDSAVIRERLEEALAAPGAIEIVGRADGERAAIAALDATAWDALVLDLWLKQGTGLGVLKAVRERRPPGAVVIVLTNYALPRVRDATLALGADHFFDKMRESHRVREVLERMAAARSDAV
jgi:two-component system OmpR family response regulator